MYTDFALDKFSIWIMNSKSRSVEDIDSKTSREKEVTEKVIKKNYYFSFINSKFDWAATHLTTWCICVITQVPFSYRIFVYRTDSYYVCTIRNNNEAFSWYCILDIGYIVTWFDPTITFCINGKHEQLPTFCKKYFRLRKYY